MAWACAVVSVAAVGYVTLRGEPEPSAPGSISRPGVESRSLNEAEVAVAAPEFDRVRLSSAERAEAVAEPHGRCDSASRSETLLETGSILPFIQWNFSLQAGTPAQVLEHPVLNAKGARLSGAAEQELKQLIEREEKAIREGERLMVAERLRCIRERYDTGTLPLASPTASGNYQPPISSDPEVEVSLCGVGSTVYEFRAAWGDHPEYDQARMRVFYLKQDAVNSLSSFLASHAP